jgi:hypothetical protein
MTQPRKIAGPALSRSLAAGRSSRPPELRRASDGGAGGDQPPGVALLITVLILFVVSLLGAAVVSMGRVDYALSGNYRSGTESLHLADSGMQATAADMWADYDADPASSALAGWVSLSTSPVSLADPFPDPEGTLINGHLLTAAAIAPAPYAGTPYTLGGTTPFGGGTYQRTIWLPPTIEPLGSSSRVSFQVRSVGSAGSGETPSATTIDAVVSVEVDNVGMHSSAAFLGDGDGGEVIDGGIVQIAGPVVVIGDPDAGAPGGSGGRGRGGGRRGRGGDRGGGASGTELSLGSLSKIVNSYEGIDGVGGLGSLADKLPAIELHDYNGDQVAALDTAVRLKDAAFDVDLLAALGAADSPGNGYKETIDGVYTDGTFDDSGINIHIDEVGAYDLGEEVVFPSLWNPYTDPISGTTYASYSDFLATSAYTPLPAADLAIDGDTGDFSWVDPAGKGSLAWDSASETLTIKGIVRIDGRLEMGDSSIAAIKYSGTGVLWATDDIRVYSDVYPAGNYLTDGPDAGSEVDGNLGLISATDIRLDPAGLLPGDLRVLATLFAEERLDVRGGAQIAGAVIANSIEIASLNQLRIWFTPTLAGNAPLGIPATNSSASITVSVIDWRHVR